MKIKFFVLQIDYCDVNHESGVKYIYCEVI